MLRLRRLKQRLAAVCRKRKSPHLELESKTQLQVNSRAVAQLAKFTIWVTYTVSPPKSKYVGKKAFRKRPFPEGFLLKQYKKPPQMLCNDEFDLFKVKVSREGGTANKSGSVAVYKPPSVARYFQTP